MKKILIVDGNSILNRAFYGIRMLTNDKGLPTNALYGFVRILKRHLDAVKPEYTVCAFDLPAPTFRHKLSLEYKANRTGMPEELALQLPYAKRLAEAMGFAVAQCEGYEGDDVIGTIARLSPLEDTHAYILTGDRDSLQLLSPDISVILAKNGEDALYTPERFTEEYGIDPSQFVDVKALMGDKSDNIPGVAGIGEKGALKLISEAKSLEKLYENLTELKISEKMREKLNNGKEAAFLSQTLAQICTAVPCYTGINFARREGDGINHTALSELFDELDFGKLRAMFSLTKEDRAEAESVCNVPKIKTVSPEELCSLSHDGICVDIEEKNGEYHVTVADDSGIYYSAGNISAFAELFNCSIICHDVKKLHGLLRSSGICANAEFDTMLAAYLLNPGEKTYPIGKVCAKFDPSLPGNAPEAWLIFMLYPTMKGQLENTGMASLLTDMEIPLAKVLFDMEQAGILLDTEGLLAFTDQLGIAEGELSEEIFARAGCTFNLNSPIQLGEVLFEKMGLPHDKKTQRGYSTDAETLKKIRHYDPIVGLILDYREISKLRSTYGYSLAAQADGDGRIHTTFNQCGTATGRLSSTEPNMQNIPVRGGLGKELRKFFCAPEGRVLVDADYSQIELRLLASISEDPTMCDAFNSGKDIHTSTAAEVFHLSPENVTPQLRSRAKAVNFGIVYGIGEYSLSQDLGISRKEAKEYIEGYLSMYPKIGEYLSASAENAKRDGYVTTVFGRRRFIPELSSRNKNIVSFGERVAKNSPIQGSAADVIKLAMIKVSKALEDEGLDAQLILQVHDELILECSEKDSGRAAEVLCEAMESVADTAVRLCADVGIEKNWYDAKS